MRPLVSILVPAYNAEHWIADTIRSALAQTWPRKEIIIVDDGSRDRTLEVARRFACHNVLVVPQENKGASGARNKAFELCQGDYIQWLDADDLLESDKVERQMTVASEADSRRTLFSGAWGYFMYRPSKAKFIPTPLWHDLTPVEWLFRKMNYNLHMQPDTWLVSREVTEAAGPWDVRLWRDNDGEYFCRVLLASEGVRFVCDAKSYYRRSGPNSVSHIGRSQRKLESLFLSMQLHVGYLRSLEDSHRTRTACVRYLQTWLYDFYPERPDIVSQLDRLAADIGGRLEIPKLGWKYSWIQRFFGWTTAKQVRLAMRGFREGLAKSWDRAMFRLQRPAVV